MATTTSYPAAGREDDGRFVSLAAKIGEVAAANAEAHDRDASFVTEAYDEMRTLSYFHLAVPTELGGLGATMRQICYAQAELARHDGATALAVAMHLYNTQVQGYRWAHGAADAEAVLRRVVDEDLIIATSGGSDWLWPTTQAVRGDGGWRISGRKAFCSQAPAASVITTCAVVGELEEGAEVLHFAVPLGSEGVRMEQTWDTLGMRATASNDLVLEDVWVPDERIVARRPWGELGMPLLIAGTHFAAIGAATYYGIAAGARDHAVSSVLNASRGTTPQSELPRVQRAVGLMDSKLRCGWWALLGSVEEMGSDYADYVVDATMLSSVMLAKREVVVSAAEVVDLAMDVVGGRAYYRRSPLERAYRDVRAGRFHPFPPEITLTYAGRAALGLPLTSE